MSEKEIEALYSEMKNCTACTMRNSCTQVVTCDGNSINPILMIIGESPGSQEDEEGIPFVGPCGQLLREVLRYTKVINRTNTVITNVLKCRPPGNKFPKDESADICVGKWLVKEIELIKPQRILLLGSTPLKYIAGMKGITACRGTWMDIRGIRGIATFHPSYVMRQDSVEGDLQTRKLFEQDIFRMAGEVEEIQNKVKAK